MAGRSALSCALCGAPMTKTQKSLPQGEAVCHPCRREMQGRARDELGPRYAPDPSEHRLARCGHPVLKHRGATRRVCDECLANEVPPPRTSRTCRACATDISDRRRNVLYCSLFCSEVHSGRRLAVPLEERECAHPKCGVTFLPMRASQRCCSERHGKALYNMLSRADGRQASYSGWNDKRREHYHRRRALKKGASIGRPVLLADIAKRDLYLCGLCLEPVDLDVPWPEPLSKSLDHVIPLTRGGLHDPSNVQLAHLTCNTAKGNRTWPTNTDMVDTITVR